MLYVSHAEPACASELLYTFMRPVTTCQYPVLACGRLHDQALHEPSCKISSSKTLSKAFMVLLTVQAIPSPVIAAKLKAVAAIKSRFLYRASEKKTLQGPTVVDAVVEAMCSRARRDHEPHDRPPHDRPPHDFSHPPHDRRHPPHDHRSHEGQNSS